MVMAAWRLLVISVVLIVSVVIPLGWVGFMAMIKEEFQFLLWLSAQMEKDRESVAFLRFDVIPKKRVARMNVDSCIVHDTQPHSSRNSSSQFFSTVRGSVNTKPMDQ